MKEELQSKLVEILTSIQTGVGKAADFAVEQLPDIAQQYITFGMVSNVVGSLLALGFSVGLGWFSYWLFTTPKGKGKYGHIEPEYGAGGAFSVIGSTIAAMIFIVGLKETLLVLFAPKVWLLMELAKLVK